MFSKVLIANRGEIACRIIRTLRRLGIQSVAVYSEADTHALHVRMADETVLLGPAPASQSYLQAERIIAACRQTGAEAVHPGYGFLSENADFAELCGREGIAFIGPTPQNMRDFGLKHTARALALASDVPVSPGTDLLESVEQAAEAAERIGYPVMIKSTAGGGGIGMQLARTPDELARMFESVQRLAKSNFKASGLFLEKYIASARHVEVQIFGDGKGEIAVIGERDCSAQRRNQKVIEETPAPALAGSVRQRLHDAARRLGQAAKYRSAGTCEFMYDAGSTEFYFLEVNTRLQVEHCVTEEVSGIDLVEWMVRLASGESLPLSKYRHAPRGHAIEARIYAEDPNKDFQPSSGLLTEVVFPDKVRVDSWVERGTEVTPHYDPMIAKIIAHALTRAEAIEQLSTALAATHLDGIETNLAYVSAILAGRAFQDGGVTTQYLSTFPFQPSTVDVLEPGTQTTIQDYPGRLGYWNVGVPPSGPFDNLTFRLVNRILNNPPNAAGLEITMSGPALRFNRDTFICLGGAQMAAHLDGIAIDYWMPVAVRSGQTLRIGKVDGPGARAYLAVSGGFDVPAYLGSKSTFALGGFGGHGGRILRAGDVLRLHQPSAILPQRLSSSQLSTLNSQLHSEWQLGVLYGPHGAPDFFTPQDVDAIFSACWKVHYNSNRTGVRLVGPKPKWARRDGGEAGLHPSNIHDNAYAIGAIDFTGDMPILLGPDGPSLGGFVCPGVVVSAELWKLGQLKAGDTVRFHRLTTSEAEALQVAQDQFIETLIPPPLSSSPASLRGASRAGQPSGLNSASSLDEAVITRLPAAGERPAVVYRGAGDRYLLVEYGPLALDLNLRFRAHALMQWLQARKIPGIIDLTPGIRSLQIHFDNRSLRLERLVDLLLAAEDDLPRIGDMEVPTRIVHLPLSWDDESTQLAIRKYMQSVRPDAPWCPSNIEFIRRINGLEHIDDVRRIVFDASYLVLGLGDVYLGAPVATPIDPRHRLVTTKYNPARTWTPQNAVGIGGAYLCIYGMEGPGGYQFVGRTVQVWNSFRATANFELGKPWLLRFFDQIRFYPVEPAELLEMRDHFLEGKFTVRIEEDTFRLRDYHTFLEATATDAAVFKARQQAAFEGERERWDAANFIVSTDDLDVPPPPEEVELPENGIFLDAPVAGNMWKILVNAGDLVADGQPVAIIESMKMEIQILVTRPGRVHSVLAAEGKPVSAGQHLVIVQP